MQYVLIDWFKVLGDLIIYSYVPLDTKWVILEIISPASLFANTEKKWYIGCYHTIADKLFTETWLLDSRHSMDIVTSVNLYDVLQCDITSFVLNFIRQTSVKYSGQPVDGFTVLPLS